MFVSWFRFSMLGCSASLCLPARPFIDDPFLPLLNYKEPAWAFLLGHFDVRIQACTKIQRAFRAFRVRRKQGKVLKPAVTRTHSRWVGAGDRRQGPLPRVRFATIQISCQPCPFHFTPSPPHSSPPTHTPTTSPTPTPHPQCSRFSSSRILARGSGSGTDLLSPSAAAGEADHHLRSDCWRESLGFGSRREFLGFGSRRALGRSETLLRSGTFLGRSGTLLGHSPGPLVRSGTLGHSEILLGRSETLMGRSGTPEQLLEEEELPLLPQVLLLQGRPQDRAGWRHGRARGHAGGGRPATHGYSDPTQQLGSGEDESACGGGHEPEEEEEAEWAAIEAEAEEAAVEEAALEAGTGGGLCAEWSSVGEDGEGCVSGVDACPQHQGAERSPLAGRLSPVPKEDDDVKERWVAPETLARRGSSSYARSPPGLSPRSSATGLCPPAEAGTLCLGKDLAHSEAEGGAALSRPGPPGREGKGSLLAIELPQLPLPGLPQPLSHSPRSLPLDGAPRAEGQAEALGQVRGSVGSPLSPRHSIDGITTHVDGVSSLPTRPSGAYMVRTTALRQGGSGAVLLAPLSPSERTSGGQIGGGKSSGSGTLSLAVAYPALQRPPHRRPPAFPPAGGSASSVAPGCCTTQWGSAGDGSGEVAAERIPELPSPYAKGRQLGRGRLSAPGEDLLHHPHSPTRLPSPLLLIAGGDVMFGSAAPTADQGCISPSVPAPAVRLPACLPMPRPRFCAGEMPTALFGRRLSAPGEGYRAEAAAGQVRQARAGQGGEAPPSPKQSAAPPRLPVLVPGDNQRVSPSKVKRQAASAAGLAMMPLRLLPPPMTVLPLLRQRRVSVAEWGGGESPVAARRRSRRRHRALACRGLVGKARG